MHNKRIKKEFIFPGKENYERPKNRTLLGGGLFLLAADERLGFIPHHSARDFH